MTDERTLLVEYAETGSETALRELVSRYVDLVYSAALRQVGATLILQKTWHKQSS